MSHTAFRKIRHKSLSSARAWILPALLLLSFTACARGKLRKELDQNRYFSEIMRREDQRFLGEDAFFANALLQNPYEEVRGRAAIALARIASPKALPLLYGALRTEDASVRAAAAFAIGEIEDAGARAAGGREPDPQALDALRRGLDDGSLAVQMRAVEALGKAGGLEDAAAILQRLERFQYNGQPVERAYIQASITALARLANSNATAILEKLATANDFEFQWRAMDALIRLQSKRSRNLFLKNLEHANPLVRACAAKGIGMLGDPSLAGRLVPLLPPYTGAPQKPIPWRVRSGALQALGALGNPSAIPFIASALTAQPLDKNHPDQQNFAVQAAGILGSLGSDQAEPALLRLIRCRGAIADAATIALAKILKSDPERFFNLAAGHSLAQTASVRAWAEALATLGGPTAMQELTRLLEQEIARPRTRDAGTLPAILTAFARAGGTGSRQTLAPFIRSQDAAIAAAALYGYNPGPETEGPWAPILEALASSASSRNIEARLKLLGQLQPWIHETPVQQALQAALSDFNYDVRRLCAALLRKAGVPGVPEDLRAHRSLTEETCRVLASNRKHITVARVDTDRGTMEIELFHEDAPITAARFAFLATEGAFEGMEFTRSYAEPRIEGTGFKAGKAPWNRIPGEINPRPIRRGSVAMASSGDASNAGRLVIALDAQPYLDGAYTCFGHVVRGVQIADTIVPGDRIQKITLKQVYPYLKPSDMSESLWHPLRGKGKLPKNQ